MAAKPIFVQAVDTNGTPYSGAKLNVYDAGTTTPRAIYTESGLGTASANPAIANANGVVVVWVNDAGGDIKVTLTNSAETVTPHNEDNVPIASLTCYPVITFQGDQSLLTTSSPTFAGLTLGNVSFAGVVTDPNADRLVFWDDSAGQVNFMTLGTGLAFNGTALELDGDLQDISGLTPTDGGVIIGDGTDFVVESGATLRASLGLGTGDSVTFAGLTLASGATVTAILDEDNMASDSATAIPTQQSVKAYADSLADTIADINAITQSDGTIIVSDGTNWVGESGATARASLGVSIGADVQAYDAGLQDISGLAPTDGNIIVGDGANWVSESGATARASLGLTIGTDIQAYDAGLASIAGLTTAADKMVYTTALDTYAVTDLSSFARTVLDDATAQDARTTLEVNTKYVANISALKALADNAFDMVDVGGYATAGDGGGGRFQWTSGDISAGVTYDTEEGVFVARSGDATGATGGWVRATDHLTASMFGGFGDATTSCVAPIQAMVNVAYVYNAVMGGSTTVTTATGGVGSLECRVSGHMLMDGSTTVSVPEGVSIRGTGGQQARYVNTTREGTVFLVTNTTTPVFTFIRALTLSGFGVFYPNQTDANCTDYTAAADAAGGPISYPFFVSRGSNNGARFKAIDVEIYNGFNGFEVGAGAVLENCRTFCVNNEVTLYNANAAPLINGVFMSAAHQRWVDATDAGNAGNLASWRHYNGKAIIVEGVADGLTLTNGLIFRIGTLLEFQNTSNTAITQTNQNFQKIANTTIDGIRKILSFDETGTRGSIGVFELTFDNCYFGLDDANNTASYTGADEIAMDLDFTGYDGGATGIGGATQGNADQTLRFTNCRWKNLISNGIRIASGCSLDRLIIDGGEMIGLALHGTSTTSPAYFLKCEESTCDVYVRNLVAKSNLVNEDPLVDSTLFNFSSANTVVFANNDVDATHDAADTCYGLELGTVANAVVTGNKLYNADEDFRISGTVSHLVKRANDIETDTVSDASGSVARATMGSAQTVGGGASSTALYNTETYDVGGNYNDSSRRFEADKDGWYRFTFRYEWTTNASTDATYTVDFNTQISNVTVDTRSVTAPKQTVTSVVHTGLVYLQDTETLRIQVVNNSSAGTLTADNTASKTYFVVAEEGYVA